ncbi:MAG: 50S ribosomal protein L23 [Chlorobi bacterium]|nr:50S ribosomal protein L23 [Chlorobiota bacterium]
MKPHEIIKRPILTEKSTQLQEKFNRYVFEVDMRANKLQIKDAIEKLFGVKVVKVNTMIVPGKVRVRYTRRGVIKGKKRPYKKAIVTLAPGESIDLLNLNV